MMLHYELSICCLQEVADGFACPDNIGLILVVHYFKPGVSQEVLYQVIVGEDANITITRQDGCLGIRIWHGLVHFVLLLEEIASIFLTKSYMNIQTWGTILNYVNKYHVQYLSAVYS